MQTRCQGWLAACLPCGSHGLLPHATAGQQAGPEPLADAGMRLPVTVSLKIHPLDFDVLMPLSSQYQKIKNKNKGGKRKGSAVPRPAGTPWGLAAGHPRSCRVAEGWLGDRRVTHVSQGAN